MIVGFTGTRNGMTMSQAVAVRGLLAGWPGQNVGLHGDCVGADDDFDSVARSEGMETLCRPCTFDSMRARTGAREIAKPTNPMARNREIARQCDVMIACPPNHRELKKGSGTWATIRYGVKYGKRVHVVYPCGEVEVWE